MNKGKVLYKKSPNKLKNQLLFGIFLYLSVAIIIFLMSTLKLIPIFIQHPPSNVLFFLLGLVLLIESSSFLYRYVNLHELCVWEEGIQLPVFPIRYISNKDYFLPFEKIKDVNIGLFQLYLLTKDGKKFPIEGLEGKKEKEHVLKIIKITLKNFKNNLDT